MRNESSQAKVVITETAMGRKRKTGGALNFSTANYIL
jgi:hypothetical protein